MGTRQRNAAPLPIRLPGFLWSRLPLGSIYLKAVSRRNRNHLVPQNKNFRKKNSAFWRRPRFNRANYNIFQPYRKISNKVKLFSQYADVHSILCEQSDLFSYHAFRELDYFSHSMFYLSTAPYLGAVFYCAFFSSAIS